MDVERQGNIAIGIGVAIVLMFFLGLYNLLFAILAGILAGLASRGSARGTIGAFVGSAIISFLVVFLSLYEFTLTKDIFANYLGSGIFVGQFTALLSYYNGMPIVHASVSALANQIIPATAGGFIGGALISKRYLTSERTASEAAPAKPVPSKPAPAPSKTEPNNSDIDKQLQRLKKMHESGTISDEEYENLKKRFTSH
ncbi:MAG: SHOCT domain-containing protein [Thermoplasmataceae archaeon]